MAFTFVDVSGRRLSKDRDPTKCPQCHHAITPDEVDWRLVKPLSALRPKLAIIYQCPAIDCKRLFIATYEWEDVPSYRGTEPQFQLRYLAPRAIQSPTFPKEIAEVSPTFVEVFVQASAAEQYQLAQVAGPGCRKSLEFLVKDYCISVHPDKRDTIMATLLGPCIQTYVDDQNIKDCARMAAWLGNDETHYERRWVDKDISDLKTLIELTTNWIRNHVLTRRYLEGMPKQGAI